MPPFVAPLLVALVALIHVAIAVVEMFFWTRPAIYTRLPRLKFSESEAKKAAPIVANAGLYNAFVAAGLIWGLVTTQGGTPIQVFFLICVIIAGVFGAATLKWTTLLIQSAPAALALAAVFGTWTGG